jgi:hypothetical protein
LNPIEDVSKGKVLICACVKTKSHSLLSTESNESIWLDPKELFASEKHPKRKFGALTSTFYLFNL